MPITNSPPPILLSYQSTLIVGEGTGKIFKITDFYIYSALSGCVVSCNFGDTLGESTSLSSSRITRIITSATVPPVFPN